MFHALFLPSIALTLLQDGQDVGLDLAGGHYEAGNRLKISLSQGYTFSRFALTVLYYKDVFEAAQYDGKSAYYWALRELRWAAEWMLKAYDAKDPSSATWDNGDRFVIQVSHLLLCSAACWDMML